ncbi:MAG: hypothetical protein ACFE0I_23120 [Elainellaceae cyanobacterium]
MMGESTNPTTQAESIRYQVRCRTLPLAIYREVAAHLRQVASVRAGLLTQTSEEFDYEQSQVGGLWIEISGDADRHSHHWVEQILTYYGDRHGVWETVKS